jgi:hypothetical protein
VGSAGGAAAPGDQKKAALERFVAAAAAPKAFATNDALALTVAKAATPSACVPER